MIEGWSRDGLLSAIITTILIPAPFLTVLHETRDDPISRITFHYSLNLCSKVPIFVCRSIASRDNRRELLPLMPNSGLQKLRIDGAKSPY
jgi:hypothetical protein